MKRKKMIAMILAGGQGSRLKQLTEDIAKPAVAFGGKYRIIDFTLTNCSHSGIDTVGVLTQYEPHILNNHIGRGSPWDLDRIVFVWPVLFLLRQSNRWGRHQTHGICRPAFRRKKHYFCIYSCMHSWLRHPYHPYESKQAKQPACTRSVPFGRHIHRRTLGQLFLDLVSRHDGHLLKRGMN